MTREAAYKGGQKLHTYRIANIHAQIDMWDSRLSSLPVNRAMVAKTMCLCIIWYHAGLMPGWEKTLDELDKKVTSFIWKRTMSKVARATLLLPKEKRRTGTLVPQSQEQRVPEFLDSQAQLGKTQPLP